MRALVLGGYGAVGATVVSQLRGYGEAAIAAGRDPRRAELVVDAADPDSYRAALDGVDVVVNAAGIEDPALVRIATDQGVGFVDITASTRYVAAVEQLTVSAPVLLSVGLAPGVTNLLAAAVRAAEAPGEATETKRGAGVEIAIVLGAGDAHGAAATDWSYQLLGRRFPDPATGAPVRNYTQGRTFALPGLGRRRLYRTDFSDQHTLTRDLGVPVRTYFGLDSRLGTGALAVLTWVPGARRLPHNAPIPGGDGWLMYAQGAGGATRWLRGRGQSEGTGVVTALATRTALGLPPGVHHLHRVLTLDDVAVDGALRRADA